MICKIEKRKEGKKKRKKRKKRKSFWWWVGFFNFTSFLPFSTTQTRRWLRWHHQIEPDWAADLDQWEEDIEAAGEGRSGSRRQRNESEPLDDPNQRSHCNQHRTRPRRSSSTGPGPGCPDSDCHQCEPLITLLVHFPPFSLRPAHLC